MESPIKKITLPVTKATAEIKEWITGADAEYIDEAILSALRVKPDIKTKSASTENIDIKSITEQVHRTIEKFVISINGIKENILKEVLSLPEEDYNFLNNSISETRNKKKISDGQSTQ